MGLLLLGRAPRALEGGSSGHQHLLGAGRADSEWGRKTIKGALPENIDLGISAANVLMVAAPPCTERHIESTAESSKLRMP